MVSHIILVAVRLAIVMAGLTLAYLSCRAYYERGKTHSLRVLTIAFITITLGATIEGVFFEFLGFTLIQVHIMESAIAAAGLAMVLYAIKLANE